jgi:serine/threonine-protein kinase
METTSTTLVAGSLLVDRYAIERSIGAGAMAQVYRATDRKYDRLLAIKVLRPDVSSHSLTTGAPLTISRNRARLARTAHEFPGAPRLCARR